MAPRLELRERLLSLLVFGVAGGILITLVAKAFSALGDYIEKLEKKEGPP